MKYIRTADRIWLSEKIGYDESGHAYSKITEFYQDFTKKDVIKEADNLEELIDEYVAIYPTCPELNTIIDSAYFFSHESSEGEYEYYGSIWVKGNLIKVAKKNENGELELL